MACSDSWVHFCPDATEADRNAITELFADSSNYTRAIITNHNGAKVEMVTSDLSGWPLYYIKTFDDRFAAVVEDKTLAKLQHPGILKPLAFRVEPGFSQMVMRSGGTEHAPRGFPNGPLSGFIDTYALVRFLIATFKHCEATGVVHRDLKLDNIVAGSDGYKLIDFSGAVYTPQLSKRLAQNLASPALGTSGYMAPEMEKLMRLINRDGFTTAHMKTAIKITTSALDVYSFGCIAYELLTGCLPPARGRGPITWPPIISHSWLHLNEFKAMIEACLAEDPQLRPTFAQLEQQQSWLHAYPANTGMAAALVTSSSSMREADNSLWAFYQDASTQQQLGAWQKKANAATKPLNVFERTARRIRSFVKRIGSSDSADSAAVAAPAAKPASWGSNLLARLSAKSLHKRGAAQAA